MTNPVHTQYDAADVLDYPGAITQRILLSGDDTNGTLSVFEDIVQPGIGPGRHIHNHQDETFLFRAQNIVHSCGHSMSLLQCPTSMAMCLGLRRHLLRELQWFGSQEPSLHSC